MTDHNAWPALHHWPSELGLAADTLSDLAHRATHDPLTNLPNRSLLEDRIDLALARSDRAQKPVAVMFVDLDGFKRVNDEFGHATGDEVLIEAARSIQSVLRPSDTVARLGGDEFVVVCDVVADTADAITIASRVNAALRELRPDTMALTASIGIALSGSSSADPTHLLQQADAAMYQAKGGSRGDIAVFDEEMQARAEHQSRIVADLDQAIAEDRLQVRLQPVIDLRTGCTSHVEAFVRLLDSDNTLLPAAEFLSAARNHLVEIDRWMFRRVAALATEWRTTIGDEAPRIHINLATDHLNNPRLTELVAETCEEFNIPAASFGFEFTETAMMNCSPDQLRVLKGLADVGVVLTIDDFGTARSSIVELAQLPVRMLKIDLSLIERLEDDLDGTQVVAAIVRMAAALGLTTVAEGVETAPQLECLVDLGCPIAQGRHFSAPLAPDEIEGYLKRPASLGFW